MKGQRNHSTENAFNFSRDLEFFITKNILVVNTVFKSYAAHVYCTSLAPVHDSLLQVENTSSLFIVPCFCK